MNNDAENMALNHYKYFLGETAKTLGMDIKEVAQIEGLQTPEQVEFFINFLVQKYGFSQKELMLLPVPKNEKYLQPGEPYNEWEMGT